MSDEIITNASLRPSDIPPPDADPDTIAEFAHTFDACEYWGSFEKCAEVANSPKQTTLAELRTKLFFMHRAARHQGGEPGPEWEALARDLVAKIRVCVNQKEGKTKPKSNAKETSSMAQTGIREVDFKKSKSGTITNVRIVFGPNYFVELHRKPKGKVEFVLGATHHGFHADASEVDGELENFINEVRTTHPGNLVD